MDLRKRTEIIRQHYIDCWQQEPTTMTWPKGPVAELPVGFQVLVFAPNERRTMWSYATCGMSQQPDSPPLEIHLLSQKENDSHVELLTSIAHYHLTGAYLGLGHTVNFGRPWVPGSKCSHGLMSLPYLDGPKLEWLRSGDAEIRFLWMIPICAREVAYKADHGLEKLERLFEESRFNYLDPLRPCVV